MHEVECTKKKTTKKDDKRANICFYARSMSEEWECRHDELSTDSGFRWDQLFHACDSDGLPWSCGFGFPTPHHAAKHLFFDDTRNWPHGGVITESLTDVLEAIRPTRSEGGLPKQYIFLAAFELLSGLPNAAITAPERPTPLVWFERTSGSERSDRDNAHNLLARMFKSHDETVVDTLMIERDHVATSRFPLILGMPGMAEYIDGV